MKWWWGEEEKKCHLQRGIAQEMSIAQDVKKTEKGIRGKRMNREEVGWRASFITKGIDIFLDDHPPRVFI